MQRIGRTPARREADRVAGAQAMERQRLRQHLSPSLLLPVVPALVIPPDSQGSSQDVLLSQEPVLRNVGAGQAPDAPQKLTICSDHCPGACVLQVSMQSWGRNASKKTLKQGTS